MKKIRFILWFWRIKIEYRIMLLKTRLQHLWNDYQPVICAGCGKIQFRKDVIYEQHRTAGVKPLCYACHRELFTTWMHQEQSKDL